MEIKELQGKLASFLPEINVSNKYKMIMQKRDGYLYKSLNGMIVIISGEIHGKKKWIHVSFSRKSRMPEYKDMVQIKKDFIGEDKKAIMIFPEKNNHVNIHNYCLHIWHCIDGDGIPEFSRNGLL